MGVTINNYRDYNAIKKIDFGETIVFFKVGADWCVPCSELDKTLVKVKDCIIYHISVDNDDFESYFLENNIYTVPDTTIQYKNKTYRFRGVNSLEQINEQIEKMKNENEE